MKSETVKTDLAAPGTDRQDGFGALPRQQQALRAKCFHPQGPAAKFPREDVESSIAARFEKIAAMYPHRTAVKTVNDALTYDELNRLANRIAHTILRHSAAGSAPIALLFGQNSLMIAASLAVLKIGRVFVPINYSMPREKLHQILDHVEQEVILTESDHLESARDLAGDHSGVLNVAALEPEISDQDPKITVQSNSYAYIFFTSGSTGIPKGVVTTHRNELHNIYKNTQILHISPDDRVSLLRSHNVGAARDLFLALLNGATLCSLDLKRHDLRGIAGWLTEEKITVFTCVTTIYREAMQNAATTGFPHVRVIHVGGEPVTQDDVALYKKSFSDDCLFVVRYSISETPAVSYYFIDKQSSVMDEQIPVGYALEGNEIIIVDDEGNALPPNEIGEVAIKSPFLAPGYWRQPELTQAKFLADPVGGAARTYLTGDLGYLKPDGCLVHMGRKDFLVKVRGFRVETGEVESALRGLDKVKDAAVIASSDANAETQLTAYVVPREHSPLTPTVLRRLLREKLPDYMIPQTFILLSALPLTANGKIDRSVLPEPDHARPQIDTDYVAPRTETENRLARIWAEALDLSTVGVEDDFVELGGHSLAATRIIGLIHEALGVEVSMRSFLDNSTVAQLAHLVRILGESRPKADSDPSDSGVNDEIGEL